MIDNLTLIDHKYCTGYRYLSDSALDLHFHIVFAVNVIYKQKQLPSILGILSGESAKAEVVQQDQVFLNFGMRKVRWFNLDTGKPASLDEEVKLNHIKHNIIDRQHLTDGKANSNKRKRAGIGNTFPPKTLELMLKREGA